MPDPFAQYATPAGGDPFAEFAGETPSSPPFVPGEMLRHRVSSDAPDGLVENLRDAMESTAHPRSAGDLLPYLIPSGVEGAMNALRDVPVRSITSGALRMVGAGLESPLTNIAVSPKAGYLGKMVNALADRIGTTAKAAEPAVAAAEPAAAAVTAAPAPTLPVEPPPIAPSAISSLERMQLLKQGYTPQMIDSFEQQLSAKPPTNGMIRGRLQPMTETARPPIQADASSLPESPLQQPRVDVGAEQVGRAQGLTKEQVRQQTSPILGEQPGEASPILPQTALGRIVDTLKAIPPGSPEREAYVARATSGKAQWQVENIRRTLEHLGLIVPAAVAGSVAAQRQQ